MDKALAMIELKTIASGIRALDAVTKAADVEILTAQSVCPGKYMILFYGGLSAVNASLDAAKAAEPTHEIDSMLLGSPADSLIGALYGTASYCADGAVGVVETFSGASAVLAADAAAKAAQVTLTEVRLSRGMCGKSYVMLSGGIAEVEASVAAARKAAAENGMLADIAVVANPDNRMRRALEQ